MEEKRKENLRRIWNSLEMGVVKRNLIMILIIFPLCYAVGAGRIHNPEGKAVMLGLTAALMLPYLLFYVIRTLRLLAKPEAYVFCNAVLDKPHPSFNHRLMYFSVALESEDGGKFMADTHAIFSSGRSLAGPTLEDYINRTITVAYNTDTGMVLVIG